MDESVPEEVDGKWMAKCDCVDAVFFLFCASIIFAKLVNNRSIDLLNKCGLMSNLPSK